MRRIIIEIDDQPEAVPETTARVKSILNDPDSVAHYGDLLQDLTRNEVLRIWAAVQDKRLTNWAFRMRQVSKKDRTEPPPL